MLIAADYAKLSDPFHERETPIPGGIHTGSENTYTPNAHFGLVCAATGPWSFQNFQKSRHDQEVWEKFLGDMQKFGAKNGKIEIYNFTHISFCTFQLLNETFQTLNV